MSELIKTIKCANCGANIQIDLDNLISYCPYCATPLMIDIATVKDVLIEKEKTKQVSIKENAKVEIKKEDNKNDTIFFSITMIVGLLMLLMALLWSILMK